MLLILFSSVRVKLLAHAKLIFLREQPDYFSFCGEPWTLIKWLLVLVVHQMFFEEKTCRILLSGQPHMQQILCSSVRVKLLARAKLIFLREQPDDFFSVDNSESVLLTYCCWEKTVPVRICAT